jgi:hypothetical protein
MTNIVRRKLKNDTSGSVTLLPCFLIIGIIFIVGLVSTIILYKARKKKLSILSIILTVIIIISFCGWGYHETIGRPNDIDYRLTIHTNATENYTIYAPYLDNANLFSNLKIKSGVGNIGQITTNKTVEHGSNRAIQVTTKGDIEIYGEIQDYSGVQLSLQTGSDFRYNLHWVGCEKSNPSQNISLRITAHVSNWGSGEYWNTGKGDFNSEFQFVEQGWNMIIITHTVVS